MNIRGVLKAVLIFPKTGSFGNNIAANGFPLTQTEGQNLFTDVSALNTYLLNLRMRVLETKNFPGVQASKEGNGFHTTLTRIKQFAGAHSVGKLNHEPPLGNLRQVRLLDE